MKSKIVLLLIVALSSLGQTERVKLEGNVKSEIAKVFEANEKLYDEFFEYDGVKVQSAAISLKTEMSKISNPEISKLLQFANTKLEEIKEGNSKEDNFKAYNIISMALIHINSKYDFGKKYNSYYCPMVKKKWLQNDIKVSGVKNPYSDSMRDCGSKESNF